MLTKGTLDPPELGIDAEGRAPAIGRHDAMLQNVTRKTMHKLGLTHWTNSGFPLFLLEVYIHLQKSKMKFPVGRHSNMVLEELHVGPFAPIRAQRSTLALLRISDVCCISDPQFKGLK